MNDYADKAKTKTWIVGVSGGVDSAVIERLCEKTGRQTICIAMPLYLHFDSVVDSLSKAMELCVNRTNVVLSIRSIGGIVEIYQNSGIANHSHMVKDANRLLEGNLRSRIRANILYDFAGAYKGLVVGTGNRDEDEIGYFTKGGDGLVDLCPLSMIHKSDVWKMAKILEVPDSIRSAKPTAGLWDGQTDEEELGMTYDEVAWAIDSDDTKTLHMYLEPRKQEVLMKVRAMRENNRHKLQYPPVFDPKE
jgi:NAD+ synthase